MMTDPIADLLTRIRNAQLAKHDKVTVKTSRFRCEILRILKDEGFIADYAVTKDPIAVAEISLKYFDNAPVIRNITRESKPGRRVYVKHQAIPEVLGGLGLCIISTSHGVMSGKEAREKRLGGELICTVY
ncbi:MAG: 30S ribosomal protein S8 [Proteobacteria bacterium]|jgi:small subunit ribosomal protein S8|nr:30S ribosomal protein S8 [Pseudomonadota bacterium]MBQ4358710.1 30S ribosomal protein S8 [Pseudomonadota bacterium]MBQ8037598.1 30S ribosomal protein S8 [Pseudomonadota bacterium]MBQ9244505.1 30S ribosomal protein S8 [Pseudomonadota bacterium]MBR4984919.1 30S ribosomal protein S8 [Pseudomonadota bacterium]